MSHVCSDLPYMHQTVEFNYLLSALAILLGWQLVNNFTTEKQL